MEEDQRKDMKKGKKKPAIQINYNLLYKIYIHRKPTEMKLTYRGKTCNSHWNKG